MPLFMPTLIALPLSAMIAAMRHRFYCYAYFAGYATMMPPRLRSTAFFDDICRLRRARYCCLPFSYDAADASVERAAPVREEVPCLRAERRMPAGAQRR